MSDTITPRLRIKAQPEITVRAKPVPPTKVRLRVMPSLLPMQIELQNTGTLVQWRYLGQNWQDLIAIDDLDTTVSVGSVTTLPPGSPATVVNVGTSKDMVLNFGIPSGIQGIQGEAATIAVGTVTTVNAGVPADVTNVGTPSDAVFDFDIPQGPAATVAVGTVTTLAPGAPATVVNVGSSGAAVFDFGIPQGDPGTDGADGADGLIVSIVAGSNITVDNTDPANPVVSSSAAGVTDGDKGDIVVSSGGTSWLFDSSVVTAAAKTVLDDVSTAAMLATLGGQPLDSDLTSWAGVTRAAGFDTFVATPSSSNLRGLLSDETGSGSAVFATSPTLVTPALGTPSALVLTNATGLTTAGIAAATLVTASETIGSNNNDTTIPTSAAVKAYVDSAGGGGMTLLGTLNMGSGSSQSLTSIPAGYNYLFLNWKGVTTSNNSVSVSMAASSTNGAAYGTAVSYNTDAAEVIYGASCIYNYTDTAQAGKTHFGTYRDATFGSGKSMGTNLPTNTAAALNALRVSVSGGSFDGGTIEIYGVK